MALTSPTEPPLPDRIFSLFFFFSVSLPIFIYPKSRTTPTSLLEMVTEDDGFGMFIEIN
ncbi:hypothetical protein HanPSC8_Chr12g0512631 [Helianthus annuus]|nr:hypothetical protein HanPSC8_Chr12g0512631 [Helianthus annuus]